MPKRYQYADVYFRDGVKVRATPFHFVDGFLYQRIGKDRAIVYTRAHTILSQNPRVPHLRAHTPLSGQVRYIFRTLVSANGTPITEGLQCPSS